MTQIEQVYNAYKQNPNITDEEIANIIECPKRSIKTYRHRLVKSIVIRLYVKKIHLFMISL